MDSCSVEAVEIGYHRESMGSSIVEPRCNMGQIEEAKGTFSNQSYLVTAPIEVLVALASVLHSLRQ